MQTPEQELQYLTYARKMLESLFEEDASLTPSEKLVAIQTYLKVTQQEKELQAKLGR